MDNCSKVIGLHFILKVGKKRTQMLGGGGTILDVRTQVGKISFEIIQLDRLLKV